MLVFALKCDVLGLATDSWLALIYSELQKRIPDTVLFPEIEGFFFKVIYLLRGD